MVYVFLLYIWYIQTKPQDFNFLCMKCFVIGQHCRQIWSEQFEGDILEVWKLLHFSVKRDISDFLLILVMKFV